MTLLIAIGSICAITGVMLLGNRFLPYKICPICAGVSGTWLWMLLARFLGYSIDSVILAMLLGASVVGIAYQLEKKLQSERSQLLWKILFIPIGFIAAYGLAVFQWLVFLGALIILLALAFFFLKVQNSKTVSTRVKELEEKMKQCC